MKTKRSEIWSLFRLIDHIYAECNICGARLSYKTSTSNLNKHLRRKHPSSALNFHSSLYKDSAAQIFRRRNPIQEEMFAEFVSQNPQILQTPTTENKSSFDCLWDRLSSQLNNHGPPKKDVNGWKKTFKEWHELRLQKVDNKEQQNNNMPLPVAGKMPNLKDIIYSTSNDDSSRSASAIVAEGVDPNDSSSDDIHIDFYDTDAEDTKMNYHVDSLYLKSHQKTMPISTIGQVLENMSREIKIVKEATTGTHSVLKEFCELYKTKIKEDQRHHIAVEKLMTAKLELKRQLIEIEHKKLSINKNTL